MTTKQFGFCHEGTKWQRHTGTKIVESAVADEILFFFRQDNRIDGIGDRKQPVVGRLVEIEGFFKAFAL